MARERWGTFSVIDHINVSALVPEILLYDRLVIPVPNDDNDRQRWADNGWNPDLLDERLETLGELAISVRWDETFQTEFSARMREVKEVADDATTEAQEAIPYQMTRRILVRSRPPLPKGVSHADAVAAYQSEADFKEDFLFKEKESKEAQLGLLLGQKIAVPEVEADDNTVLLRAIDLAISEDFKRKRRKLYAWQEDILEKRILPARAIDDIDILIKEYNECVKKAANKVKINLAFTLAAATLGIAGLVLGNPLAGGAAFLAITKFVALDRKPNVVVDDEYKPAAMFHDIKNTLGWDIV